MSTVINIASAKGSNTLVTANQVSVEIDAPGAALTIVKSVTPTAVLVGQILTYSIVITNIGPGTATNVIMEDTGPSQVNFNVTNVTTSKGTIDSSSNDHYIKVNVGDMVLSQIVKITIPATAVTI
jgi:uncharacterized repeat protein (TIGR01451 family)